MGLAEHHYTAELRWTGNQGSGTSGYRTYSRDHEVEVQGAGVLLGTADPTFHGSRDRWNPEQLLLAALAQCHMLSYLHVAVRAGVVVTGYRDTATGTLRLHADGSGEFTGVVLHPQVELEDPAQSSLADRLHAEANSLCFIARSVNFPVQHEPSSSGPAIGEVSSH
ncbi:OsmC family peroxiredoxin [Arthrobacter echini]|uniref:OsmC family peroxiredoxin n=1 Tax=Arthrobacter echini TaxID=1529066 RepID=A0A4S5E636_9MICC|nr:OsmC family protein [Arthrobacter echini]THJ66994.1 OsmC family peroxiredoxin [Arthrobacter echini]